MGLIVGVTLVAAGVILFVMMPVLRGDWAALESPDDEVTEVDARKQAALRGLRDAEYDFRSGKIDESDYRLLKSELARQALEAIEEARAADPAADEGAPVDATEAPGESAAEEPGEIAASEPGQSAASDPDGDRLEAEIARVRKGMAEGRTCLACGHLNVAESSFCTDCGGALAGVVTTAPNPASG